MDTSFFRRSQWTSLLLRAGLAFVFIYASIESYVNPGDWVGFLPTFMTKHVSGETLLDMFGVAQLALSAWLLSGIYVRYAALLCAAMLAGIMLSSPSQFLITFRDISIFFAALALAALPEDTK